MRIPCPCLQSVHLLSAFTSAVSAEASDRYSQSALGSLFRGDVYRFQVNTVPFCGTRLSLRSSG